ncbi:pectinesterase [Ranunculus cassubicifolius]
MEVIYTLLLLLPLFTAVLPLFTIANQEVVVNPNGSGDFTTIMGAVSAIPPSSNSSDFFTIRIAEGVYSEYVVVPAQRTNLKMVGAGINKTVITGNRSVKDGWKTSKSATFAVFGNMFVAINMTFRNSAGPIKEQAVAVRNDANPSVFYLCSFEGYQDTLLTNYGLQFYRECDIYGTVDIIFGRAKAFFQNSKIYARLPMQGQSNVLTADGRETLIDQTGIILHNAQS